MNDADILKLLLAARDNPQGRININLVPGWDYRRLSHVVKYCYDKNLIEVIEVTNRNSPFKEFIVTGITTPGADFLQEHSPLSQIQGSGKKIWTGLAVVIPVVAGIVAIVTNDKAWNTVEALVERVAHLRR